MFPDIAYLDWITGRPERASYDLASSDLARSGPAVDAVVPPALAERPTPDATVADQLAEIYDVGPENVLVTAGATHANFLAAAAALDADGDDETNRTNASDDANVGGAADDLDTSGGRVLVEKPGYEPLLATPAGLGATVDRFRRPAGDGYHLDADRVSAALVEDTELVTLSNRHNPSGHRVERNDLAEVARAVADASAHLLVDEVYAPFGSQPVDGAFGGPTAAGLPNTVVTNSLTKFFGFGGVRLGWLVADAEFVARARSVARHVPAVAEPSRRLARRALADADRLVGESRERVRENHETLASFVADREDLSGRVEDGCTYAFLVHESADGTQVAEAAWGAGVLVVPGRFFDDPDGFRVAACRDPATVRKGLDRLGEVLDGLAE